MQVLNIASNVQNTRPAFNSVQKNNFSPRLLNEPDTVSFGRKKKDDEGEEEGGSSKPKRKGKGGGIFKAIVGIFAALGLASGGVQGYNAGNAYLAQRSAMDAFKDNPKQVALRFINKYAMGDAIIAGEFKHLDYSVGWVKNPFEVKNWNDSVLGPDSVVGYDFTDGAFSSATLDIDGDKHPEIAVTIDEDGKFVISYDYDSDGKIDTVEKLTPEEE